MASEGMTISEHITMAAQDAGRKAGHAILSKGEIVFVRLLARSATWSVLCAQASAHVGS